MLDTLPLQPGDHICIAPILIFDGAILTTSINIFPHQVCIGYSSYSHCYSLLLLTTYNWYAHLFFFFFFFRQVCVAPDTFSCRPGFSGFPLCAKAVCHQGKCHNGGSCSLPDTCACAPGWFDSNWYVYTTSLVKY